MSSFRDSDNKPREKKSWREIDRARESGARRQTQEDRDRGQGLQGNSSAYEKYKKNLERMWNNGRISELANGVAPAPGAAKEDPAPSEPQRAVIRKGVDERQKEREAFEALRKAVGPAEVKKAVEAVLEMRPGLPNDFELLSKALASPSEAHQQAALRGLDARPELGTPAGASLLKSRLQTVMLTASDDETRQLAQALKSRLG